MLIRSQDRIALIDLNDQMLNVEYSRDAEYRIYAQFKYCVMLGVYSSEEKAIKVLDMIQEAYEKYEYENVFKTGTVLLDTFQMPDDSEVEV